MFKQLSHGSLHQCMSLRLSLFGSLLLRAIYILRAYHLPRTLSTLLASMESKQLVSVLFTERKACSVCEIQKIDNTFVSIFSLLCYSSTSPKELRGSVIDVEPTCLKSNLKFRSTKKRGWATSSCGRFQTTFFHFLHPENVRDFLSALKIGSLNSDLFFWNS